MPSRGDPISVDSYRPPSIRAILGGVLLLIAVLLCLASLSDVVKLAGAPFLYIPDKLGLIRQVSRDQVMVVPLDTSPTVLEISTSGSYVVFTANDDLLNITNLLGDAQSPPWLTIESQATGERLTVSAVERGLRPYDTVLARGRPIYTFVVRTPGWFKLSHPIRHTTISVLPDYTSGKERLIALLILIQVLTISAVPGFIYFRSYRRRKQRTEVHQEEARRRADEMRPRTRSLHLRGGR